MVPKAHTQRLMLHQILTVFPPIDRLVSTAMFLQSHQTKSTEPENNCSSIHCLYHYLETVADAYVTISHKNEGLFKKNGGWGIVLDWVRPLHLRKAVGTSLRGLLSLWVGSFSHWASTRDTASTLVHLILLLFLQALLPQYNIQVLKTLLHHDCPPSPKKHQVQILIYSKSG